MNKALEINTVSVSIKVVSVDGKRLTKAVFNQIQEMWPFDERFFCIGTVLGYVVDGSWHLLWVFEGELKRYSLYGARRFAAKDLPKLKGDERLVHYVLGSFEEALGYEQAGTGSMFADKFIDMACKQTDLKAFLLTLTGQQLYIAI